MPLHHRHPVCKGPRLLSPLPLTLPPIPAGLPAPLLQDPPALGPPGPLKDPRHCPEVPSPDGLSHLLLLVLRPRALHSLCHGDLCTSEQPPAHPLPLACMPTAPHGSAFSTALVHFSPLRPSHPQTQGSLAASATQRVCPYMSGLAAGQTFSSGGTAWCLVLLQLPAQSC